MGDWLSRMEQEKKLEMAAKDDAIEEERQWHERKTAECERKSRTVCESFCANEEKIEKIYKQIETQVGRVISLTNLKTNFTIAISRPCVFDLKLQNGEYASLYLTPDRQGFHAHFVGGTYSMKNVNVERNVSYDSITEKVILDWLRWLAEGKGRPWRQRWWLF